MDNECSYSPSHPWFYQENEPLPVEEIKPAALLYDIPKTRQKQEISLEKAEKDLAQDIERYLDLVENGEDALSKPDRMYGYLHTSLSLKHNHISYDKGLIIALKKALGPKQASLF